MGTGAENVQQGPPPVSPSSAARDCHLYNQPCDNYDRRRFLSEPSSFFADDKPTRAECPRCKITVTTRVENQIGACWWIICFVGFFLICWPILYILCCNVSKDATHSCPNCGLVLGRFKRAC
ncbi:unnamed protein product [Caenorhabditis auriculariae]|uniref:LITAF domain-containing protein n=1 Tax=Caenorhabditis auriculariae TaxID=2777116 RepID=A0A8S1HLY7_9PELO|nr:unnamed protein product [Caenorhabditis auriculariae]